MNTNSVRLLLAGVFLLGLASCATALTFVQVSDTHIGFSDPLINPDHEGTLAKIVAAINNISPTPDFVVFTGDLTHTTDEAVERRARMEKFRTIASQLKIKYVHFLPGEHDAGLDSGEAFKEYFGPTYYSFAHQGIHFIVIDNVSDPTSSVGETEMSWLKAEVKKLKKTDRVVILTHRPLFDLYPQWDWWTRNGAEVRAVFKKFKNVPALYGHIHQLNQAKVDNIDFHSAHGAMYPLPAPGSVPKRAPVAWDPAEPYKDLGFRSVTMAADGSYRLTEYNVYGTPETADPPIIKVTAKKFEFSPNPIVLKKGQPTELDLTSLDVHHGFNAPGLGVRADIVPGTVTKLTVTAKKTGTFPFFCDYYCGAGHENMTGSIEVTD